MTGTDGQRLPLLELLMEPKTQTKDEKTRLGVNTSFVNRDRYSKILGTRLKKVLNK